MKYITINEATVLRFDSTKKDAFGDIGTVSVNTLPIDSIIDIDHTGSGGRGIVATPYLFFANGDFIIGYNAKPYDGSESPIAISDSPNSTKIDSSIVSKAKGSILFNNRVVLPLLAASAYGIYKAKDLPQDIPHEGLIVGGVIVGGIATLKFLPSKQSSGWSYIPNYGKNLDIAEAAVYLMACSLVYGGFRVFKASPKVSLIAGLTLLPLAYGAFLLIKINKEKKQAAANSQIVYKEK